MRTVLEENFANGWCATRGQELQELIDAHVQADPNKLYSYADFLANLHTTLGFGIEIIAGITDLMETRINYLLNHQLFQGPIPEITNLTHTPEDVGPDADVWINAEISNADLAQLGYRHTLTEAFQRADMFDDGIHNDGAADDGVYGILIHTGTTDVDFYIYAENDLSAAFSPARAEYEFHTMAVHGDLVINEFMASNDTTVPDPSGEYDDWIELYNNSTTEIALSGHYLSDDASEPTKWAFPDTSIAGHAYLIIWADDDEGQPGLHANFKLSASGEAILLLDASEAIIDEVTFGPQTTDISTGRYPNGIGPFIEMFPTFGSQNISGSSSAGNPFGPLPRTAVLRQNSPNPFKSRTSISFSLSESAPVSLDLFDLLGRHVRTLLAGDLPAGEHVVAWTPDREPSGIYYYCLRTGRQAETRRMTLLR